MKISEEFVPSWAEGLDCAVTVSDIDGKIIYMNERSRETFAKYGDVVGKSLFDLHGERACGIIRRLLDMGDTNTYTISKEGRRKLIHQMPWRKAGKIAGLVEISIVIPETMPHYQR